MKPDITISHSPGTPFGDVARKIADGKTPDWLMVGLEHFSDFVGAKRDTAKGDKRFLDLLHRMHDAADLLIKNLPFFSCLPAGLKMPNDVVIALDVLPRIKADLALAQKRSRGGGPRPNVPRQVCAAVIVEAWKLVHGHVEPRSPKLAEACNEYWQACGHEYRGDDYAGAWRRDIEHAVSRPQGWIQKVLEVVRNSHPIV
jgi:hypothetical protein